VLEETDEYRILRDPSGVICQDWKHKSCIPHYIDFTLKTADDWPEFKKRLQPDPGRIPENLDEQLRHVENCGLPIAVGTASMMGWIRNWMGVANMSYLMYDAPDCYADMVDTIADLVCWELDIVLPKIKADMGFGWEDICGRSGPLVSPHLFEKCVAPGYTKVRNKLEEYGVTLYGIDSDGDVSDLVGPWLEAGVNVQFPVEVGPWKGDAHALRKRYGRDLRVIGNFDKLTLEQNQAAVLAELERLRPLMREGGFVMMPDHLITPGVSLDMYRWYLDQVRNLRL
jgi:uroporphyrinogen decarboxylase